MTRRMKDSRLSGALAKASITAIDETRICIFAYRYIGSVIYILILP